MATTWLDDDQQRAWRAFLALTWQLQDALDRQLQRDAQMPHAYYMVLVALSEAPGRSMRMNELATALHSSPSRLSHAVSRLEEAGWVRRERCAADKRGNTAVLTTAGLTALRRAAPGHVDAVRSYLFDALSPAQVAQLHEICEAALSRLEQ
jgi:DNA-binding MarR family transcriptional regulator